MVRKVSCATRGRSAGRAASIAILEPEPREELGHGRRLAQAPRALRVLTVEIRAPPVLLGHPPPIEGPDVRQQRRGLGAVRGQVDPQHLGAAGAHLGVLDEAVVEEHEGVEAEPELGGDRPEARRLRRPAHPRRGDVVPRERHARLPEDLLHVLFRVLAAQGEQHPGVALAQGEALDRLPVRVDGAAGGPVLPGDAVPERAVAVERQHLVGRAHERANAARDHRPERREELGRVGDVAEIVRGRIGVGRHGVGRQELRAPDDVHARAVKLGQERRLGRGQRSPRGLGADGEQERGRALAPGVGRGEIGELARGGDRLARAGEIGEADERDVDAAAPGEEAGAIDELVEHLTVGREGDPVRDPEPAEQVGDRGRDGLGGEARRDGDDQLLVGHRAGAPLGHAHGEPEVGRGIPPASRRGARGASSPRPGPRPRRGRGGGRCPRGAACRTCRSSGRGPRRARRACRARRCGPRRPRGSGRPRGWSRGGGR